MGIYATILKREAGRLVRDEEGVALMLTLGVFLFLFLACCGVYAIGETISRRVDLQNACDAGAHAAAVAQADILSRMAVVNRAMSWNYVQMTKEQMDYITYNWLKVTCDNFAEDKRKCMRHTGLGEMLSRKAGYCFLPEELQYFLTLPLDDTDLFGIMHFMPRITRNVSRVYDPFVDEWHDWIIEVDWGGVTWLHLPKKWTVINCYHNIHNKKNNRISNYIGMRSGNDTEAEEIKINGYDVEDTCLHFRQSSSRNGAPYGGDLDYVVDGEVKQEAILSQIEDLYGGYGCPDLAEQISSMKGQIGMCNVYLENLCGDLKNDIKNAASEAIRQSLPRTGESDRDIVTDDLEDYYSLVFGGVSPGPREYAPALSEDESKAYNSFFSGVRNNEQDEMLFLNMADGLPEGARVTLADYFIDDENRAQQNLLVPGLDQWFVRCYDDEAKYDSMGGLPQSGTECGGDVCILRDWGGRGGIQRCYKNANYHELRTQFLPSDIHRGNYCFDGVENAVNGIVNSVSTVVGNGLGKVLGSAIPVIGPWVGGQIGGIISGAFDSLLSPVKSIIGTDMVLPSCENDRSSFPDTCSEVKESTGLVAEYEWATAYWICWYKKQGYWPSGSVVECGHLPLAFGEVFGGATDNGYKAGTPFGWMGDALKNFIGKGHSRNTYRTECMFIDGEKWNVSGCGHESVTKDNGHGANVAFKSYVRVYGDDRAAFDANYYGVASMPYLLNEDFFNGGGTIVVGLARKNRNAFEALLGAIEEKTDIFSLFTPWEGSHMVAFSAGRAAYAPRTGRGTADGPDSFNANGDMRYDLHYDATAKNLVPRLPSGGLFDSSWRRQKEQLEKSPYFFGCVCTEDGNSSSESKMSKTRERLRRQWNLCQTDWDGVLLPLRYARAAIGEWFANKEGNSTAPALDDRPPEWGKSQDAAFELATLLMDVDEADPDNAMLWRSLDGNSTTTLEKLLKQGDSTGNLDVNGTEAFAKMILSRRIL